MTHCSRRCCAPDLVVMLIRLGRRAGRHPGRLVGGENDHWMVNSALTRIRSPTTGTPSVDRRQQDGTNPGVRADVGRDGQRAHAAASSPIGMRIRCRGRRGPERHACPLAPKSREESRSIAQMTLDTNPDSPPAPPPGWSPRPSLTEAIAPHRAGSSLVGATDWCTHPADLIRVRGTKIPNLDAIADRHPTSSSRTTENRRTRRPPPPRPRHPVWVTDIETVPQALTSLRRLLVDASAGGPPQWLDADRLVHGRAATAYAGCRPDLARPWMVVGHPTFTADLLARLGYAVRTFRSRYPHADLAPSTTPDLADLVLLPDRPTFTADGGPRPSRRCHPTCRWSPAHVVRARSSEAVPAGHPRFPSA